MAAKKKNEYSVSWYQKTERLGVESPHATYHYYLVDAVSPESAATRTARDHEIPEGTGLTVEKVTDRQWFTVETRTVYSVAKDA